jgi:hypothetical protein
LEFYEDQCETTPTNVSTYVFKLMAKDSAGTTIFTWDNAIFASVASNARTVTLSPVTTAAYPVGEYQYELQVTIGADSYTWMAGFIEVTNQITS